MPLSLTCAAFDDGASIPARYTCDGLDTSPALQWTGVPTGTASLLLTLEDPDAPGGVFHHWAVYDLSPDFAGLPEGAGASQADARLHQGVNDFGLPFYRGPCPPRGDRPHRYRFRIAALSEPIGPVPAKVTCATLIARARSLEIESAEWLGRYGRAATVRAAS